jgi:hypothetical protein
MSNAAIGNEQVQALVFCNGWMPDEGESIQQPAGQRFMAERGNAKIEEVAASHASMVRSPRP